MGWTHNASLLPLEGLAGNKFYATTSDSQSVLSALTGTGQEYEHVNAAFTLPALTLEIAGTISALATSDITLPALTLEAGGGGSVEAALPSLTLNGVGTVNPVGRVNVTLPMLTLSASGLTGVTASAYFSLPRLRPESYWAGDSTITLPALELAAHAWAMEVARVSETLPSLRSVSVSSIASLPIRAEFELPSLIAGPYASVIETLPAFSLSSLVSITLAGFEGWVMNLRSQGVSRFTQWPFKQLVRRGNELFAVGSAGVYRIGGDTDAGQPISWAFETGLHDLDAPGVKRIPYLYIDGIIDGRVNIKVVDDAGNEYVYRYENLQGPKHKPHRRELGKGIRTRNVALGMSSTAGAYIEIDSLEPEVTVTQRSI